MTYGRSFTPFTATVLDCFEEFHTKHGYSPTYRQVSEMMGGGSTSAVSYAVDTLIEMGYITPGVEGQVRTRIPTYKTRGQEDKIHVSSV